MTNAILAFAASETGALGVEWVVFSSLSVGLALGAIALISATSQGTAREAEGMVSSYVIDDRFDTEQEVMRLQQAARAAADVRY
ncbi:hypothetical protein N8I71_19535 [Roseibacterium sp. SDUM158016]|uniref:hypothetical protein n=1 Tax=Roseicyclus sediminis TaxID=2980997 RepID=UPI0021D26DCB|nr:hypothetical protein [Roseibacterium sp. SDUM158016]MCU4655039.1 hypothetical protein [Roseibacterium sp. SDUM158016]